MRLFFPIVKRLRVVEICSPDLRTLDTPPFNVYKLY